MDRRHYQHSAVNGSEAEEGHLFGWYLSFLWYLVPLGLLWCLIDLPDAKAG